MDQYLTKPLLGQPTHGLHGECSCYTSSISEACIFAPYSDNEKALEVGSSSKSCSQCNTQQHQRQQQLKAYNTSRSGLKRSLLGLAVVLLLTVLLSYYYIHIRCVKQIALSPSSATLSTLNSSTFPVAGELPTTNVQSTWALGGYTDEDCKTGNTLNEGGNGQSRCFNDFNKSATKSLNFAFSSRDWRLCAYTDWWCNDQLWVVDMAGCYLFQSDRTESVRIKPRGAAC